MSKNICLPIAVVSLVVFSSIFLFSCILHNVSLSGVNVADDGSGGAYSVFETKLGGDLYVERVDPNGKMLWTTLLGKHPNDYFHQFFWTHVLGDNSGVIISFPSTNDGNPIPAYKFEILKLDTQGNKLWQKDVGPISQIVSDGAGGAIFVSGTIGNIEFQRLDSGGSTIWDKQTELPPDTEVNIASDGEKGVIMSWLLDGSIYLQKISEDGQFIWGSGVLAYASSNGAWAESPDVISDGEGGAIVVWKHGFSSISSQKVDTSGKTVWQENGLQIPGNASDEPVIATDGDGGAIISWSEFDIQGNTASLRAQRVNASGSIVWQAGGINVSRCAINPDQKIVISEHNSIVISYFFIEPRKDLHVQKISVDGKPIWSNNGALVAKGHVEGYTLAPDNKGEMLIGWGAARSIFGSEKDYVQKIDSNGKLAWGSAGIQLN